MSTTRISATSSGRPDISSQELESNSEHEAGSGNADCGGGSDAEVEDSRLELARVGRAESSL